MKILSTVFKTFCITALLLIGFFFSDMTHFVKNQLKPSIAIEDTCQLSTQPCVQNGVDIQLQKDTLTPLEPSSITVKWPNTNSEKLLLSLQGVDMEMGNPIFQLTKTNNSTFEGEILLPICTQNTMVWTGTLTDGNTEVTISLKAQQ
ncbi:hypothetical protein ERW51_03105 [Aliivibrio finisterrensis]|jgi:hypothetical protein|uniref:hypothetical protein n=1 Tax=Aliivibrio finisterrensis TaxID=511998 RepID=UPI001021F6C2|nr:hypothetical protein [Aliivibrio finisterrensis]RYU70514.1 hypothetical protein ERW54_03110 [Aliivibrio finisterrensis]RYU74375.1 hypothetical protein ERW51_03105 [Aliivibrio finisterrensis]RYU76981.1 hypothetical protein ERW48_03120 [Aliivibrio finisterrensis]